jgi:hypothetical protein
MGELLSTKLSESKCDELSTVRVDAEEAKHLAATAWQLCREALPFTAPESDELLRYKIGELQEIIFEAGPERFNLAIRRCLRIYSKPWELSVANIRREAGLDCSPTKPLYVEAWELITQCVRYHVGRNADGRVVLEPRVTMRDGRAMTTPVPELSEPIRLAVDLMGGWESLQDAYPSFWGARLTHFRDIYRP